MTFFITRPPDLTTSPRPLTKRTPIRLSRAAPAMMRRGPEMFMAATAPMVGSPLRAEKRPVIHRLEGQLLAPLRRARLTSDSGVPAAGRDHQLGGLVERDAGQSRRATARAPVCVGRPMRGLGAAPAMASGVPARGGVADDRARRPASSRGV